MNNTDRSGNTTSKLNRNKYGVYDRTNYILMVLGFLVLVLGYALMTGGHQAPDQFNFDEIYSFRRITLSPIIIICGFLIEIYAVLRKGKTE